MKARISVKAVAEAMEWSDPKVWRIETGRTAVRSLDVEAMCRLFGASAELTEGLCGLARETKEKGWWHSYGDVIPAHFDLYVGLESAASALHWYESELVPGLFQTADYARAIIEADNPGVDPAEIDGRVALRRERQTLLTRAVAAPTLVVVLNEAILRRPVGGTRVMADQLTRLQEVGELPTVTLRVVPFAAGLHAGVMSGPFVILRFPTDVDGRETEPPVVYVDGHTGALYLDKTKEVKRYDETFERILEETDDHDGGRTRDLIRNAMKELGG